MTVLAAIVLRWPVEPPSEQPLPPPDIALLFDAGNKAPPATQRPDTATDRPARGQPVPAPPRPVEQPTPAPAPVPAPAPAPAPAPPPAPQLKPTPVPASPPLRQPGATPVPAAAPPPHPAPRQASRQAPRAAFPQPIMRSWSLGSATAGTSFGAAMGRYTTPAPLRGPTRSDAYDLQGAESLGRDWRNEFMAWVDQHKHYPEPAIANQEDGTNEVTIRVARDGRVQDVSIDQRSGSQWLDLGTLSLFRGRQLPPFPPDVRDDAVTIQFTMHYIILR